MIVNLVRRPRQPSRAGFTAPVSQRAPLPAPRTPVPAPRAVPPRQAVFQLPAQPVYVRAARTITEQVLTAWDITGDDLDAMVLLVGELTANAAVHGGQEVVIALDLDLAVDIGRPLIHLCVSDLGQGRPRNLIRPLQDEHGRGLQIVAALAEAWEAHSTPSGLRVLVDYRLTAPVPGP